MTEKWMSAGTRKWFRFLLDEENPHNALLLVPMIGFFLMFCCLIGFALAVLYVEMTAVIL